MEPGEALSTANDVNEQDMADLQLNFLFNLGGHPVKLRENKAIDNSASRRPSRTKLDVVPCVNCSPDNPTQFPPGITSVRSQCDRTISCVPVRAQL